MEETTNQANPQDMVIPKTVLIVEDDMAISNTLRDNLSQEGYDVKQAFDGKSGLEMAVNGNPSIIILDLMLPQMDGIDVLAKLHEIEPDPKSHVLVFSNLSDLQKVSTAVSLGAEGYFIKAQTTLNDVIEKVKEVYEKIVQQAREAKDKNNLRKIEKN